MAKIMLIINDIILVNEKYNGLNIEDPKFINPTLINLRQEVNKLILKQFIITSLKESKSKKVSKNNENISPTNNINKESIISKNNPEKK